MHFRVQIMSCLVIFIPFIYFKIILFYFNEFCRWAIDFCTFVYYYVISDLRCGCFAVVFQKQRCFLYYYSLYLISNKSQFILARFYGLVLCRQEALTCRRYCIGWGI